jgi:hypothetical protein
VGTHCLNEDVAFDYFGRQYCDDRQFLGLNPAGHEVYHSSLLSAGCADCVYRSLLSLGGHDLALLSSCGSLASRQLVQSDYPEEDSEHEPYAPDNSYAYQDNLDVEFRFLPVRLLGYVK